MGFFKIANEKICHLSIIIFILFSLINVFLRMPFYDEVHAYLISFFNFKEILEMTKVEGHPILWYLILKPFNNMSLFPFSISFINFIFSTILILFFWKFAPFNNLFKFLITFSVPFIGYFAIISRPYTLCVLIIFLLTYFFNQKTKKPILYSLLLVFCANLTVISAIISLSFLIMFLYELIKAKQLNKTQLFSVFSILSLGYLGLFLQLYDFEMPKNIAENSSNLFFSNLSHFIFSPFSNIAIQNPIKTIFHTASFTLFYYLIWILFKKDSKTLIFAILNLVFLISFFGFIYIGNFWHYYFFFIILICTLWLSFEKIKNDKFLNIILAIFFLFSTSSFSFFNNGQAEKLQTKNYNKILKIITSNPEYKKGKIFCNDIYSPLAPGILPYLKKEGITLFDARNNDRTSFINFRNLQKNYNKNLELKNFVQYLDKNKKNYLMTAQKIEKTHYNFSIKQDNIKLYFKLTKYYPNLDFAIYEIQNEI